MTCAKLFPHRCFSSASGAAMRFYHSQLIASLATDLQMTELIRDRSVRSGFLHLLSLRATPIDRRLALIDPETLSAATANEKPRSENCWAGKQRQCCRFGNRNNVQ